MWRAKFPCSQLTAFEMQLRLRIHLHKVVNTPINRRTTPPLKSRRSKGKEEKHW